MNQLLKAAVETTTRRHLNQLAEVRRDLADAEELLANATAGVERLRACLAELEAS